jgi:hypothetical protein
VYYYSVLYCIIINKIQGMSGIPSQPIGYGDAKRLLEIMGGQEVPASWRGRLPGMHVAIFNRFL